MTYPIFINLEGLNITFVGGGRIAYRKLKNVLGQGAHISVVAPMIIDEIRDLSKTEKDLYIIEEKFNAHHLSDSTMVFITSDDETANQMATDYCKQKGILMNNCMDSTLSSFRNGAVTRNGEVEIAIATGGKRPGIAKWIREQIEQTLPDQLDEIIDQYDEIRKQARDKFDSSKDRESYIKEAFKTYLEMWKE